jgi:phage tail sheath protein FI
MPEYLAPGVYIEEVSFRPKSIEGVSTSTTAFVGPSRKGPLSETPEVITSFGEFARIYGGLENLSFSAGEDANPQVTNYLAHAVRAFFENGGARLYIGRVFIPRTNPDGTLVGTGGFAQSGLLGGVAGLRFIARMPGSGLNGIVRVSEKRSPATTATMNVAPDGSLLRLGGDAAAQPAIVTGGTPSFVLNNGDQLTLSISGGAPASITFNGTPASVTGTALADPVNIPAATTFTVTVGGLTQTVTLPNGNTALADLVNFLNTNLRRCSVSLQGGDQIVITSDTRGTSAAINVSDTGVIGFAGGANAAGTGNVANLDAVTVAEIDGLLQAAAIAARATQPPSTNALTIATTATGAAATIQVTANAGQQALGLPTALRSGSDGAAVSYYRKLGGSWVPEGGGAPLNTAAPLPAPAHMVTMNVETEDGDGSVINYDGLGFSPEHSRYIGAILAETPSRKSDALQNPYYLAIGAGTTPFQLRNALFGSQTENSFPVTGGNDGALPAASTTVSGAVAYEGAFELLESIEDISIIAAPGHTAYRLNDADESTYQGIQQALIGHAQRMWYRIAVLDTPPGYTPGQARAVRSRIDSTHAALYYPWVIVANPLARPSNDLIPKEIALPPSGFISGIYARNDIRRGVWKAPANEVVLGALRFEREINKREQDVMNPEGVNNLRYFPGRGYRVWGARTVSSDPEWKYVNVRRYFIYLERSIDRSTQWAVFEPNGEALWANIRETVSAFLYNEWVSGALLGSKPEQAFFVRCDRSTMTQNDLDNGRLICEIGVAVLKPAEYVIFRIGQKTADARG